MHLEAMEYMMMDHVDDPDFADNLTYIPYNRDKIKQKNRLYSAKIFRLFVYLKINNFYYYSVKEYDAGQLVLSDSWY
jgi:hypothetical protein